MLQPYLGLATWQVIFLPFCLDDSSLGTPRRNDILVNLMSSIDSRAYISFIKLFTFCETKYWVVLVEYRYDSK